ncbi:hypothetical protein BS78_04G168800 [Paspalum vaginatum]|nr:hypothetical protein BS78_04G168800 [Paspalum vaginatum]
MELELSLGDSRAPPKGNLPALTHMHTGEGEGHEVVLELGVGTAKRAEQDNQKTPMRPQDVQEEDEASSHNESPVELSLGCPLLPASAEIGSVNSEVCRRGIDVNTVLVDGDTAQGRSNLLTSSLPEEFPVQHQAADQEAAEDEENSGAGAGARKKLRLSKEQSAFLEDSFKEHSTLNPKSDLANRLNLRPRQVEVWFQNRRARTKLKQTEVDCEYLKRCCETLAQENRRLQREVAELRAMRTAAAATYPFYGFSTARVCPSCDIKNTPHSPAGITTPSAVVAASPSPVLTPLFSRPHLVPFTVHPVLRRQPSATS